MINRLEKQIIQNLNIITLIILVYSMGIVGTNILAWTNLLVSL